MDINDIHRRLSTQLLPASGSAKLTESDGFERIFRREVSAISPSGVPGPAEPDAGIIDQSTRVLDLLDDYVRELNDPSKTLKDIDPLVRTLDREVTRIEERQAKAPEGDATLDGLVKQLTVTARVAMLKYQRGDFV